MRRYIFWLPRFSAPCLLLGLLFFALSLTPSLIPRDPIVQGILGGVVTAVGYLVSTVFGLLWWAADMPRLNGRAALVGKTVFSACVVAVLVWTMTSSLEWQNELREKMEMEPAETQHIFLITGVAALTFFLAYILGSLVAALFRWVRSKFYRIMPVRRANVLGVVTVVLVLFVATRDGIFDRLVVSLDESYEAAQKLFDVAPPLPPKPSQAGSAASLIDWATMGQPGRDFVLNGPDAGAISKFTGRPALDPIRVYVGRANGETPTERAQLALAELKRLGAFEREVLIVTSPTGTGWMDPGSHDPVEYMHDGDIAT
ncbi:MAG: alpha/beta-hydrolase N-terminal domain-containing protein, partial [Pseudomonadota bacterium]